MVSLQPQEKEPGLAAAPGSEGGGAVRGSRPWRPGLCFATMLRPTQSCRSEFQLPSSRSGAVAGAKFQTRCGVSGTLRNAEKSLAQSAASRVRPGCWAAGGQPGECQPCPEGATQRPREGKGRRICCCHLVMEGESAGPPSHCGSRGQGSRPLLPHPDTQQMATQKLALAMARRRCRGGCSPAPGPLPGLEGILPRKAGPGL